MTTNARIGAREPLGAGPAGNIVRLSRTRRLVLFAAVVFWLTAGALAVSGMDAATTISLHTSVTLPIDI